MMRVLLVDDEPLALDRLEFAFRDIVDTEIVGMAANGEAAALLIAERKPDLVILDIQMPGRTGLAVAAELVEPERPEIVFVTAYEQYAPDAFDVEAVDYLIKPVRFDRLRQAVERARRRRRERLAASVLDVPREASSPPPTLSVAPHVIVVPDARGASYVATDDIQWIEAAKDYVLLHTPVRSFMMRSTMSAIEALLPSGAFARVHRSAIVNLSAIKAHCRTERGGLTITLKDAFELNVGPSYVRAVANRLAVIG